jgi:hypothetical protein
MTGVEQAINAQLSYHQARTRGEVECRAAPLNRNLKNSDIADKIISNVLRDVPFS